VDGQARACGLPDLLAAATGGVTGFCGGITVGRRLEAIERGCLSVAAGFATNVALLHGHRVLVGETIADGRLKISPRRRDVSFAGAPIASLGHRRILLGPFDAKRS
jgi:hypothetical protein